MMAEIERLRSQLEKVSGSSKTTSIIAKEKTIKKFSGEDESVDVNDWVTDCRHALKANHYSSRSDEIAFILQNLEGTAKREAKLHINKDSSVEDIFKLLIKAFSGVRSYTEAQKKSYDRRQRPDESVRDFSLALYELMEKIVQTKPDRAGSKDEVLRDHFIFGIRDTILRRKLKKSVSEKPVLSFLDVRDIAKHWTDDVPASPTFQTIDKVSAQHTREIDDLKQMIRQQQKMITELTGTVQ